MAATTLALLSLVEGRALFAAFCVGAALLLKGPIGWAVFAAVAAPAVLLRLTDGRCALKAALMGTLLAAPWFAYVAWETHGEFAYVFFWYHNVQRATGGSAELASHPVWFYPARWLIDGLPVSLAAVPLLAWAARSVRGDRELRLGLLGAFAITALLSLSRFKRADYLLPAYPWAAIAVGCAAERLPRRVVRLAAASLLTVSLLGGAAYKLWLLPRADALAEKRTPAAAIRATAGTDGSVIFFRVEDHALALHVGKPLMSVRGWENLDIRIRRLDPGYIVMPLDAADAWPGELHGGRLREVYRYTDRADRQRPRSWVLMESRPGSPHD
jgi:hypothetical protein